MKLFLTHILKFSGFGVLLLLGVVALYLIEDPFKVLYTYTDYSYPVVLPNRDYVSTEVFNKNRQRYAYNSFVLGSSRTLAFRPASWKKYLPPTARPYMFDASAESLYGIYSKLTYLDSLHVPLQHVLVVLCRDVSFNRSTHSADHLFIKHPAVSGESKLDFHYTFFKAYLSPAFLTRLYAYKLTGTHYSWMKGYVESRKITYDTVTNELRMTAYEKEIASHPHHFYSERKSVFYRRVGEIQDTLRRITEEDAWMLKEIQKLFQRQKTHYKVVMSPLYDQVKLSAADAQILRNVFGENFYDFSGKNKITDSKFFYYETSHYRPAAGDRMLKEIYTPVPLDNTHLRTKIYRKILFPYSSLAY